MNNADLPAMPLNSKMNDRLEEGYYNFGYGLTKREYFAGLAMQGLLSSIGQHDVVNKYEIANDACNYADALLKHLEK